LAGAGESTAGGKVDAAGVSVDVCSGAAAAVSGWLVALRADERVLLLGELEEGATGERCLALWGEVEVDVKGFSKSSWSLSLGRRAGL